MIPAMPTMAAAIPPTTAPVETFALLEAFPLLPEAEGVGVEDVSEGRVNEVTVLVGVVRMGVVDVTEVATGGATEEVEEGLEDDRDEEGVDDGVVLVEVEEGGDVVGVGGLVVLVGGVEVVV
jgi:hypothetical protein